MGTDTETADDSVEIYTGLEIVLSQSFSVSSTQTTKLVLVVGPVLAGKTTLISRIFDKFHDGPIGHWRFSGSETIVGYERILRHHRSNNIEASPTVERTGLKRDPELFHLSLRKDKEETFGLLLANISGEIFVDLIQTQDAIQDLNYFQRAAHVSILIDGQKLVNKAGRAKELRNALIFLERLNQAKYISDTTAISFVLAKADAFRATPNGEVYVEETLDRIKAELIQPLKNLGINAADNPICVIAQPLDQFEGFEEVLDCWAGDLKKPQPKKKLKAIKSSRMIDRYKAGKK